MDSTGFQKSSIQLADTRLVSTSTLSAPAQEERAEAIKALKEEDDGDIFAWLKLARSLEQSLRPHPDHACLTRDQVRAIAALRHCTSNDISAWLHLARNPSFSGTGVVSVSPQVHNWAPDQGHTASSVRSGAKTPNPAECSSNHKPKQQVAAQNSLSLPFPTATIPPPQAKPKYCCTLCGYVRPFKNQSDWKKHEREHDTTYFCMLKGPMEATPQGAQCSFCGILNPDGEHLLKHNAQACLEGTPRSFSCKRRRDMVNHLGKIHDINLKSRGEAIAEKWKYTVEKRAWSCGFCVKVFFTFHDRLSHIASQHFERGQTIEEWDNTKVIQGLLQQSSMIKAWKDKMASLPAWEIRDIIWVRDAVKELQHDLEVGPNDEKSAVDLAEAAYIACRLNWGMGTQRALAVSEAKSEEAFVATSFLPNQSQALQVSAPEFGFNHHQSLSAGQGVSEASPSGPATQTIMNYDYSSTSLFDLNDSENIGPVPSPFFSQQTQSATEHQSDDNNRYGGLGNEVEESQVWSRAPGLIHETGFDSVFI